MSILFLADIVIQGMWRILDAEDPDKLPKGEDPQSPKEEADHTDDEGEQ